jgi:glycosyltransferase involved in cell wall biosynthesis
LHNKQSIENDRGLAYAWSNNMLQTLIYDEIYISSILNIFKHSECRVISPLIYEPIREQMVWGKNKKIIEDLYKKSFSKKFNYDTCPLFPAGSFYWFRPELLEELSRVVSGIEEFPVEPIPDDGTLPHALERYIGILEKENKSEVIQIRPLDSHVKLNDQIPKVSIIIPVFNCEKYLFDSVNSCLQQDINIPVEIIIVDNCSTDYSLDVSNMYEAIYSGKVKVIQEKKKGAGVARNSGIKFAKGDFVTFLDADDILTPWAIRTLWDAIKSDENAEFVAGSLRFFSEIDYGSPIPHGSSGEIVQIDNEDILSEDWNRLITDFGPCAKLYRKNFLELNNLYFPEGNFEDNFFVCNAYNRAKKIKIVKNTVYLYRKYQSREGLTQSTRIQQNDVHDQINVFLETLNSIAGSSDNKDILMLNQISRSIIMKLKEKCDHLIANSKYDLHDLFYMANEKQKNNIELYMEIK